MRKQTGCGPSCPRVKRFLMARSSDSVMDWRTGISALQRLRGHLLNAKANGVRTFCPRVKRLLRPPASDSVVDWRTGMSAPRFKRSIDRRGRLPKSWHLDSAADFMVKALAAMIWMLIYANSIA